MFFNSFKGSKIIDLSSSKMPLKTTPTSLKGSSRIQIKGQSIRTPIAKGSENIAKKIHKRNVNIIRSTLLHLGKQTK